MRTLLLAAAATVAACAAPAGAAVSSTPCSVAAAQAAVVRLNPKPSIPGLGQGRLSIHPADIDTVLCYDFTRDGRRDLAMTVASGGTAGDIGWLVLVATGRGYGVARVGGGYKLGLARRGGDLVVTQPVYRKNDPNCCPTGGFDHRRWHWNGRRFVVDRSWHTRSFRA